MRKIVPIFIVLVIIIFGGVIWYNQELGQVSNDQTKKSFIIPKGAGVSEIATSLKSDGLIKSELAFKLYVKQANLSSKIQAGTFKLSPSLSGKQIAEQLTSNPEDVWVTFIEGWRIEEMAQKLAIDLDKNSEEFVSDSKEGYMFPDTYLFPRDINVKQVAKKMKDTFDLKYNDDLKALIKKQGLSPDEGVILASIVEREARTDKVRTEVASILLKRLKIGMGLNADATIQYALGYQGSEKSWWKKSLTKDDLKIESSYNTYLHRGLPPTPICNPSLSSLKAVALADSSTPYLYYYHDSKGNSYYAKTLEEQNTNAANHP